MQNREDKDKETFPYRELTDQFGNVLRIKEKLSQGGQGIVYRTFDPDIAIKQPITPDGELDFRPGFDVKYSSIRALPLPRNIHVTLPLSILKNQPGYVMRLLDGMKPLSKVFQPGGRGGMVLEEEIVPDWLAPITDKGAARQLCYYAKTGGARSRLEVLYLSASLLARLHLSGLVYGDVSPNNIFIGKCSDNNAKLEAWLIDVDNIRYERMIGGGCTWTPRLGAPEIVQGVDASRPRSDCWAFAVMAFELLTLSHPFIGKKVMDGNDDADDWALEPNSTEATRMPLDEQAYSGMLPYVNDQEDDSNRYMGVGLPIEMVSSRMIQRLFLETFSAGRTKENTHKRPNMVFWALELARAFDLSISCPNCGMSYFAEDNPKCPFCDHTRPAFIIAYTESGQWKKVLFENGVKSHFLPHRLFHPFSLLHGDDTEYEAIINIADKIVKPARGTRTFPARLKFDFVPAANSGKDRLNEI